MKSKKAAGSKQKSTRFPFEFLLRWTWPDHIDRMLKLTLWKWLNEEYENCQDTVDSDYLGTHLCWLIAIHPDTPPAVLDVLANLGSSAFQVRVAENPNTWVTTLARLAKQPSSAVRLAVADNRNTAAETVLMLSEDECADVRFAVAANANHPVTTLKSLTQDENCYVASRAKKTLARLHLAQPPQLPVAAEVRLTVKKVVNLY
ncbi:MAG: hypothetical protein K2Z81_25590 [Cyanobacteria bacterium]|nr:hypothetical protein [Cyanobacteriota bacterium]